MNHTKETVSNPRHETQQGNSINKRVAHGNKSILLLKRMLEKNAKHDIQHLYIAVCYFKKAAINNIYVATVGFATHIPASEEIILLSKWAMLNQTD